MTPTFALLTAAKNESQYIDTTIRSVLAQTVRPLVWVIVDDGSSDDTAAIIAHHAMRHRFIRLQRNPAGGPRSFGAQYRAINAAFQQIEAMSFDFVGVQDADIAVEDADYYQRLLVAMTTDRRVGIAGGWIHERDEMGRWLPRRSNSVGAVAGGIQMFRRECFTQVGGFTPLSFGGEDWLVQLRAKMAGWSVLADPSLRADHYRPTASAGGRWRGLFRLGQMDASFGSDIVFEAFKCARRMTEKPYVVGSVARFAGFVAWRLKRRPPLIPADAACYLRTEQRGRMRRLFQPGRPVA
jgi:poly-beta-1,6-N-acetyl-D-glucosamine synthase